MKKWLIPLAGLAAVVITGTAVGLAMAGGGEAPSDPPITSIDDIDPNECNFIHSIEACGGYMTDKAKADLAARLGVDAAGITLVSRERVEWPDTSLGVSKPGMMYAQVITPGYKIVLSAGDQTYEYHTDLVGTQIEAAW